MPLRQSTLNFGTRSTSATLNRTEYRASTLVQSSSQSTMEVDTIVVDTTDTITQLPTPSESSTDVSSQTSEIQMSQTVPKSRSKRVSSARARKSAFREDLDSLHDIEQDKSRSVSGETLVAVDAKPIQTTFLHENLDALMDLDNTNEREPQSEETGSVITVQDESENEKLHEEQRLAKKLKMEENAKKWEERKKAAEQNATRRSGRASLMTKATQILDDIKNTVLGKRSRGTADDDDGQKQSSKVSKVDKTTASSSKRKRVEEEATVVKEPVLTPKKSTRRRSKKWLVSGLYAGQPRVFDARLTEDKNKRKSKAIQEAEARENKVIPLPMFAGERLLQYGRDFKLPFDVFSPLPAGQPKPDEWKKVNKNVFVGDAAEQWRTNKLTEHSRCVCDTATGCNQDCMNKYMYYECDPSNCTKQLDECGNRAFEGLKRRTKLGGKFNVGVEVIKTEDRGYGVRSNRMFRPNQIIVEYTGEIVTQEECERRMRTIYKNNECYYLMLFDQNMIIDATRGSIARFVNHSCEPNCRMEKWTVRGKPRMALFAGDRGIMTGDELTYDYNFDPYSQKNVQECRCGAATCRGVLGPKPKPEAKRPSPENEGGKKKDGKVATKRKGVGILEVKTNLANKKSRSPGSKSPKKSVLVKKITARKVSTPKTTAKVARSDSKIKKLIVDAKSKAEKVKGRRVVSASSATQPLLARKYAPVIGRQVLKAKVKSLTRSVRGR